ncbi:MAG: FixH family protein [Vicinamibacterales bacterium]
MTGISMTVGVAAIAAVMISAGCGNGSEQPATERASPVAGATQAGAQLLEITLTTDPDPVTTGNNTFQVMVMQDGKPVTDAAVSTEFVMAAMPSMNMPEMRTKTDLTHASDGTYRGKGQVTMAGKWDVTVTVMRGGQEMGSKTMTLTAK